MSEPPTSEEESFDAHMRDLEAVGGPGFAPRLLRRFVHHMDAMVSAGADGTAPSTSQAHRTAGLAGMFGFREAADAWSALEDRGAATAADLSRALDAASRCVALARKRLDVIPPAG